MLKTYSGFSFYFKLVKPERKWRTCQWLVNCVYILNILHLLYSLLLWHLSVCSDTLFYEDNSFWNHIYYKLINYSMQISCFFFFFSLPLYHRSHFSDIIPLSTPVVTSTFLQLLIRANLFVKYVMIWKIYKTIKFLQAFTSGFAFKEKILYLILPD